eukprot:4397155-Amphidinium_carterae.1
MGGKSATQLAGTSLCYVTVDLSICCHITAAALANGSPMTFYHCSEVPCSAARSAASASSQELPHQQGF